LFFPFTFALGVSLFPSLSLSLFKVLFLFLSLSLSLFKLLSLFKFKVLSLFKVPSLFLPSPSLSPSCFLSLFLCQRLS
jgi:hypothetical protein